jgi:hypothetical protein
METSLLKTLANKHQMSVGKIWKKHKAKVQTPYGPRRCITVTYEREGRNPLVARFGSIPLRQQKHAILKDQVTVWRPRRTGLIERLLADECELCGSHDRVEVHHVRKLADLKVNGQKEMPDWKQVMVARQRKTLVVCRACHVAIHREKPKGHLKQSA